MEMFICVEALDNSLYLCLQNLNCDHSHRGGPFSFYIPGRYVVYTSLKEEFGNPNQRMAFMSETVQVKEDSLHFQIPNNICCNKAECQRTRPAQ